MINQTPQEIMQDLGFRWVNVTPGQTSEIKFLSTVETPIRKVGEQDRTVYLFTGAGLIPDSSITQDWIVVSLEFVPLKTLDINDVIQTLNESPTQSAKSNYAVQSTIYDFPKQGITVTTNNHQSVIRVSRRTLGSKIELTQTVSQTVPRRWYPDPISNFSLWIIIGFFIVFISMLAFLIKRIFRKPDVVNPN